jgi:hypothetical protein
MDEDNIPTKKFKVSFEFDAIPYNKDTYELMGDYFFSEWPEDIYAKEDVGDFFQKAIFGMGMAGLDGGDNIPRFKRFMKMVDQMRSTVKIEAQ